jgi:transcriptional regulator with XRE-family HTH domain
MLDIRMTGTSETSLKAIGARLELSRRAFGLNQTEFAAGARIKQNAYNQYESGKKRPGIDSAIALRSTYGLTLDWIYCGDPSSLPYKLAKAVRDLKDMQT